MDVTSIDEFERLERTVQRVFARCSALEARVAELERELALARAAAETPPVRPGELRVPRVLGCRVRGQERGGDHETR